MTAAAAPVVAPAAEMAALIETAGYRLTAQAETLLVGERPIPGHPRELRVILCYRPAGILPWVAALMHRKPLDLDPLTFSTRHLHQRACFTDADAFGLWLGGVSSIQIDQAEVRAIRERVPHGQ